MDSPLFITLKTSFAATVITFFLGIFFAYAVINLKRFKGLADAVLTLPMILPPTVVGFFFAADFRQARSCRKISVAVRCKLGFHMASSSNFGGSGLIAADVSHDTRSL